MLWERLIGNTPHVVLLVFSTFKFHYSAVHMLRVLNTAADAISNNNLSSLTPQIPQTMTPHSAFVNADP